MVLGYHIIFAAYGFWLPNDPRGSWSTFVAAWELLLAGGKATAAGEPRSAAHDEHDWQKRLEAKAALKYDAVEFNGRQALGVAQGFIEAMREAGYVVYACSILPSHVHVVLGRDGVRVMRTAGHGS